MYYNTSCLSQYIFALDPRASSLSRTVEWVQILFAADAPNAWKYLEQKGVGGVINFYCTPLPCSPTRCTLTCLVMMLCLFYPKWLLLFQFVVVLQINSQWILMYSSLLQGKTSFKVTDPSGNLLLRLYYSQPLFDIMCAGSELFYVFLYIAYFSTGTGKLCIHMYLE